MRPAETRVLLVAARFRALSVVNTSAQKLMSLETTNERFELE